MSQSVYKKWRNVTDDRDRSKNVPIGDRKCHYG